MPKGGWIRGCERVTKGTVNERDLKGSTGIGDAKGMTLDEKGLNGSWASERDAGSGVKGNERRCMKGIRGCKRDERE